MADRTGECANWCTFATWASKQAGQTIRKEDLRRLLESRLVKSRPALRSAEHIAVAMDTFSEAQSAPETRALDLQRLALDVRDLSQSLELASDAVGRGNKKVFDEIGYEFARFFAACLPDEVPNSENIERFCLELRPGEPPEGQHYLRRAFTHYYRSFFEGDPAARANLIFLANIEIGFHEQTRLQPEIAESLDAGLISSSAFIRQYVARLFPRTGRFIIAYIQFMELLGRPTALGRAIRLLLNDIQILIRQTLTDVMMTIRFPDQVELRLGDDLSASFPESLKMITNPELLELLAEHDPTPDSLIDSGAVDWANLAERLHYIIDMFRCFQEDTSLSLPPFTPEQVELIKAGKLPPGRL
jgi:hypothetical protein